mgnify:CR=1 FL=1
MLNLIPQPRKVTIQDGAYHKGAVKGLTLQMPLEDTRLIEEAGSIFSADIPLTVQKADHFYLLKTSVETACVPQADELKVLQENEEGYLLALSQEGLFLYAMSARGLFYGMRTIIQLFAGRESVPYCRILDWPRIKMRSMYYDLRQTFPYPDKLIAYIREMADYKINTLIIEHEDKIDFQYDPELTAKEAVLTEAQLHEIKQTAYRNFIEIIPLQQTFGHLEYVLKHDKYRHLRETPEAVGEMCPCREESFAVAAGLLDEIISAHPLSRYVHIGCDEVWSLLSCPHCQKRYGHNKNKLFIDYVNQVINHVCEKEKIPIIWHDMLGQCSDEEIGHLDNRAVVMIWLYNGLDVEQQVTRLARRFRAARIEVMGAPAVRCHDSDDLQNIPHFDRRIANIDQWVNAAVKLNLSCLVSTNWATAFSMGAPYGLLETSFYLMYYSAERYWNPEAESSSYLSRYLEIFHGMAQKDAITAAGSSRVEDYYLLIPSLAAKVNRKKEIAELFLAIHQFEESRWPFQAAISYAYRYQRYKACEAEMTSLKYRISRYTKQFKEAKTPLYEAVAQFLPPQMARMYVDARYTAYEFLSDEFFDPMLASIAQGLP